MSKLTIVFCVIFYASAANATFLLPHKEHGFPVLKQLFHPQPVKPLFHPQPVKPLYSLFPPAAVYYNTNHPATQAPKAPAAKPHSSVKQTVPHKAPKAPAAKPHSSVKQTVPHKTPKATAVNAAPVKNNPTQQVAKVAPKASTDKSIKATRDHIRRVIAEIFALEKKFQDLGDIAAEVTSSWKSCIDNAVENKIKYIDSINEETKKQLAKLAEIRKKVQHCGDNIRDTTTANQSKRCAKNEKMPADTIMNTTVPNLNSNVKNQRQWMENLKTSLAACENEFLTTDAAAKIAAKKIQNCIQRYNTNAYSLVDEEPKVLWTR